MSEIFFFPEFDSLTSPVGTASGACDGTAGAFFALVEQAVSVQQTDPLSPLYGKGTQPALAQSLPFTPTTTSLIMRALGMGACAPTDQPAIAPMAKGLERLLLSNTSSVTLMSRPARKLDAPAEQASGDTPIADRGEEEAGAPSASPVAEYETIVTPPQWFPVMPQPLAPPPIHDFTQEIAPISQVPEQTSIMMDTVDSVSAAPVVTRESIGATQLKVPSASIAIATASLKGEETVESRPTMAAAFLQKEESAILPPSPLREGWIAIAAQEALAVSTNEMAGLSALGGAEQASLFQPSSAVIPPATLPMDQGAPTMTVADTAHPTAHEGKQASEPLAAFGYASLPEDSSVEVIHPVLTSAMPGIATDSAHPTVERLVVDTEESVAIGNRTVPSVPSALPTQRMVARGPQPATVPPSADVNQEGQGSPTAISDVEQSASNMKSDPAVVSSAMIADGVEIPFIPATSAQANQQQPISVTPVSMQGMDDTPVVASADTPFIAMPNAKPVVSTRGMGAEVAATLPTEGHPPTRPQNPASATTVSSAATTPSAAQVAVTAEATSSSQPVLPVTMQMVQVESAQPEVATSANAADTDVLVAHDEMHGITKPIQAGEMRQAVQPQPTVVAAQPKTPEVPSARSHRDVSITRTAPTPDVMPPSQSAMPMQVDASPVVTLSSTETLTAPQAPADVTGIVHGDAPGSARSAAMPMLEATDPVAVSSPATPQASVLEMRPVRPAPALHPQSTPSASATLSANGFTDSVQADTTTPLRQNPMPTSRENETPIMADLPAHQSQTVAHENTEIGTTRSDTVRGNAPAASPQPTAPLALAPEHSAVSPEAAPQRGQQITSTADHPVDSTGIHEMHHPARVKTPSQTMAPTQPMMPLIQSSSSTADMTVARMVPDNLSPATPPSPSPIAAPQAKPVDAALAATQIAGEVIAQPAKDQSETGDAEFPVMAEGALDSVDGSQPTARREDRAINAPVTAIPSMPVHAQSARWSSTAHDAIPLQQTAVTAQSMKRRQPHTSFDSMEALQEAVTPFSRILRESSIANMGQPAPVTPTDAGISRRVQPQELIDQIVTTAKTQLSDIRREITVRLDPPELGELHLRVTTRPSGELTAQISTAHQAVRELLDACTPELRQSLANAGLQISNCTVSLHMQANDGRQQFGQHGQQGWGTPVPTPPHQVEAQTEMLASQRETTVQRGGVDYFA